jgi:dihydrofolate reductase
MTLDGAVQAPSYADEERAGGFRHGGWHTRYFDAMAQNWVLDNITQAGAFLFGRRTHESFAAHWPTAPEDEPGLAEPVNTRPKYVASTTLTEPLAWHNAMPLHGDVPEAVAALKREDGGGDLHVIGSTRLVQTLIEYDLADEFRLMLDPIVVGGGKRLFRDDGALRALRLVDRRVTTGAILASYARPA